MSSLLPTIETKSDQLNADDLIGGPRNITITKVKVNTSDDQPVWVYFKGDNGKPFKPCKTMRKLLVQVWGDDSTLYAGRSLTLYCDPNVKFGGMAVGGIRISHASHMDAPRSFFLTETRGKKKQHTVEPLKTPTGQVTPQQPTAEQIAAVLHDAETAAKGGKSAFTAWWNSEQVKANNSWARKVVNGLLPGTESKLEALQAMAVQADAATQQDEQVTEDDPFSTSEQAA